MKSFNEFISEAGIKPSGVKTGKGFVKGWTLKNKIHTSTTNFDNYHIKQVVNKPSKFGLTEKKILKIISDVHPDAPEKWWKEHLEELQSGVADNSVYIEEYLKKKGYCMFVLDSGGVMRGHGSVQGWDEKSCRLGAKALDDKYLPFEVKGFKLFEVKPVRGRPKYITSKYEWYEWLEGKKAAGKRTKIGSTMAQFRESVEYVIWGIPPKDKDETLLLTTGRDGKRITKKSDAMKLLKLLVTKHGVKKARIQALDVEVDPSDMFRNPFG